MKVEQKVKQHEALPAELIHLNEESSRRLKVMENISSMIVLVAVALIGLGILASSLGYI